jgi:hypothetical protein
MKYNMISMTPECFLSRDKENGTLGCCDLTYYEVKMMSFSLLPEYMCIRTGRLMLSNILRYNEGQPFK